jgi:hypothetical protein
MRALPIEIRERVSKLMLLLSSSHDGERAAAAAAIGRALQGAGCDWHDLVSAVTTPASPAPSPSASKSATPPTWTHTNGPIDLPRDQLLELLDLIEERMPFLPIKSASFCSSLRDRSHGRPVVHLSPKQWAWLQDLMIRATGA